MYRHIERDALEAVYSEADPHVLHYEVKVHHMDREYPGRYFAKRVDMRYWRINPITGEPISEVRSETITSRTGREPPPCTHPEDEPDGPEPEEDEEFDVIFAAADERPI